MCKTGLMIDVCARRYLQNTGGLPPADMTTVEWYLKEVTELAAKDHRHVAPM